MKVTKAIIPAAGLGTRFLPTSKSVPKELLPVLDKPLIQYGIEELVGAGIDHIIIVTSPSKVALKTYFQRNTYLEQLLVNSGNHNHLNAIRELSTLADITFIEQEQPLGLGHAIIEAASKVGEDPFVVALPDDVILPTQQESNITEKMIAYFDDHGTSTVAVKEVPIEHTERFGIVQTDHSNRRFRKITALVEKPLPHEAPSNLAIVGRYVFTPELFTCLKRTQYGSNSEIQLTDGMALLLETQPLYAYQFLGEHLDGGTPLSLVIASLRMALHRADTHSYMHAELTRLLANS